MPARIDNPDRLIGKVFGRLLVLSFGSRRGKSGYALYWLCRCECGVIKEVSQSSLKGGQQSCGCLHLEVISRRRSMRGHPQHKRWLGMLGRCLYPGHSDYENYGGRGITVCKRWRKFENWLEDMGLPPSPLHTLNRVNNDKGYMPSNVVWSTFEEQNSNTRRTKLIKAFGLLLTAGSWERKTGLAASTIRYRIAKGITAEIALKTTPVAGKNWRKGITA